MHYLPLNALILFLFAALSCQHVPSGIKQETSAPPNTHEQDHKDPIIYPGAYNIKAYLPLLKNKNVGMVVNQTSMVGNTHLVDSLLQLGVNITMIFAPEHGFRGDHSAGEHVKSTTDAKTGIEIYSLYGNKKKPGQEIMSKLDVIVFDIQDVGVRFYTYISTMHYVMEACAEQNVPFIVLDRPNPNGHYVDGPTLKPGFQSFVGMHPVPLVHGMTIGEFAGMINGEKWLKDENKCDLTVIPCAGYNHSSKYRLPVRPSPNLPNMTSVYLYPSIGLFEGTKVSLGRGTPTPFQVLGTPHNKELAHTFVPVSIPGVADKPPFEKEKCYGVMLVNLADSIEKSPGIDLYWLKYFYRTTTDTSTFFNAMFNKLAGNSELKTQIIQQKSDDEIRATWQMDLQNFLVIRKKYLLYP